MTKHQEIRQAKSKHESIRKHVVIIQNKLLDKKQSPRVNDLQKALETKTTIREASTSNVLINECDGDNINARIDNKEDITQSVEKDRNNNIDVKDDVVSSSNDNDSKDDNDNICDIEVEDFTSNVPINECDGDNIDARVVDEKNIKQPVEHVRNNNTDVKVDVVSSLIDNDSKVYNINNINKDKYSTLHVDMWDNNMKVTTTTIDE